MSIIIQKYGGTSVESLEKIQLVAQRIAKAHSAGKQVVVVLSAMAKETNRLLGLAKEINPEANPKFTDMLAATGEQVSIALMAMALENLQIQAEPFLAHQIALITDENHGRARIREINIERLQKALNQGKVAVVAGFQGVTVEGAITTIGRGGSDVTAVALAAALKASSCEIFTDVEGVFTADPRLCENARKLNQISYEEMLELADCGAKVLHTRSVEIAAKYGVKVQVRSSFSEDSGTWIVPEEEVMEDALVSGITCNINEAKVAIRQVPDKVGVTAHIFEPIAKSNINVDMILQNVSEAGFTDLTFTVPKEDLKKAIALTEVVAKKVEAGRVEAAGNIAKISIVGVGMRSHAGVAHTIFETLANQGIGIQMISTSEIKVSVVVDIKYAELAVRVLHEAFSLGGS
ncbi:MAG: aspartate kinase [Pseudomonadota bacterium]